MHIKNAEFSSIQSLSHVLTLFNPMGRPPCPLPTPRVYSNSCPLSWSEKSECMSRMQSTLCKMLGWMKHKPEEIQEIQDCQRGNINNLRYADDTTLMAESEEELKSFLMKMKEESEKSGLKLNIQKMNIMEFSPITSWPTYGEKNENSERLYFLGLQNHCGWWLQPRN